MEARRTFVIAEVGSTHDGNPDRMRALVDLAADAGADAVKFQWLSNIDALVARRNAEDYRLAYERIAFPLPIFHHLVDRAHARGLKFGCTVYLPEDVEMVDPFVDFYKVAAFEAEAEDLLGAYREVMAGNEKVLYVSLGLGHAPVKAASIVPYEGRVKYLHCTSAYPAPLADLDLATLGNGIVGLSDHSDPTLTVVGAMAVSRGAEVVERHVMLEDTPRSNPDAVVSMGAHGFAAYVAAIRAAEAAVGSVLVAGATESEKPLLKHKVKADAPKKAAAPFDLKSS